MNGEIEMGSAGGFLWLAVVILVLAWALQTTGTVSLGVNLGIWLPILLGITLAGAVFNMFVRPLMGRSRETRTAASAAGTPAPVAPVVVPAPTLPVAERSVSGMSAAMPSQVVPMSGAASQEVIQETRDKPTL
jgi:hypothetical protein